MRCLLGDHMTIFYVNKKTNNQTNTFQLVDITYFYKTNMLIRWSDLSCQGMIIYKFIQRVTFIYYLMYYYLVTGSFICNVILHINATRQKDESLASKKWKMIRHPRSIRNEYLTLRLYQICGQTIEEKETIFGGHKNLLNIHHSCFKSTQ